MAAGGAGARLLRLPIAWCSFQREPLSLSTKKSGVHIFVEGQSDSKSPRSSLTLESREVTTPKNADENPRGAYPEGGGRLQFRKGWRLVMGSPAPPRGGPGTHGAWGQLEGAAELAGSQRSAPRAQTLPLAATQG